MDPAKIDAIINWPRPDTGKRLQSFLGAAGFNRDYSHLYASIAAPLDEVKNVIGPILWTEERISAFESIKKLFAQGLELQTIDWNKLMYLTPDASLRGIGAWIGQMDDKGEIIPVVCVSKKLTATQQRWSTTKRELYALMWSMQKLRHYLLGRKFVARVDHRPLVSMLKNRMTIMMEGWIDTILQFDFTTEYLPGPENVLADALSRCHDVSAKSSVVVNEDVELRLEAERRGKTVPSVDERVNLLERAHAFGHFSVGTLVKQLWSDGFWWPKMRQDARNIISACVDCRRYDIAKEGFHPIKSIEANEPWDHIQFDLIGPLPESTSGYEWIFTIVDVMTGYVVLRALRTKNMDEVGWNLWTLICDFGVPKIIQSDNGLEFVNSVVKQLSELYGIDHRLITPYNPRADGLVERMNKEVGQGLKKRFQNATDQWEKWLPLVQLGLNAKLLQRTGSQPFELFFGRPFVGFGDWKHVNASESIEQNIQQRLVDLEELH